MLDKVTEILRDNRVAALATADPDGWPHCTMVGIANEGTRIYFVIARDSQKFTDIGQDNRVSMAIGRDVIDPSSIRALAIKGRAQVVEDESERHQALDRLLSKRPALQRLEEPDRQQSAVMVAIPEEIRLLDYSRGYGHSVLIKLDASGKLIDSNEQVHSWGYGSTSRPVD